MKYEVYLCGYETEQDACVVEAGISSDAARIRVEEFEKQRVEFKCAAGEEAIAVMIRPAYSRAGWKKIVVRGELLPYYYAASK